MKISLKSSFFLLMVISTYIARAQESKNVAIKGFNSISVSSGIDLYLTQGGSESATIKGEASVIKDVVIEQSGGNIAIKFKDGINWGGMFKNQTIKVYVNYKTLSSLAASGGSDVYTQNQMNVPKLAIHSSGGSDVKLDLVCTDLSIASSGGSDIILKGKAENMSLQTSGGSDVKAYDFITQYAKVSSSGGSDAYVNVAKGLDASASGGSDVHYKGNAALKSSASKSGDIIHVN